jgi:glyceraldehyde 3-phosphate dehydrogenase
MAVKVAINGFGRIGRIVFREAIQDKDIEIVAVNDLTNAATLAHLVKYDSVHGKFKGTVAVKQDKYIVVNGREIEVLAEKNPAALPWKKLGVDVVVESTGKFRKRKDASLHLEAGARKVIISAPSSDPDAMIVIGVNEGTYKKDKHHVISMASCTTNCLAPIAKILNDSFGIEHALMTTIHAYTNDQVILDFPHKDLRRARAAGVSMIPTTTGAASAVGTVLPELAGKLNGVAVRVPVADGSIVDLVAMLKKDTTVEAVNDAVKKAALGPLKGIVEYCEDPIVSIDVVGNPHSSIFDSLSTMSMTPRMFKVFSWYDNEFGYSRRIVDLMKLVVR